MNDGVEFTYKGIRTLKKALKSTFEIWCNINGFSSVTPSIPSSPGGSEKVVEKMLMWATKCMGILNIVSSTYITEYQISLRNQDKVLGLAYANENRVEEKVRVSDYDWG
jgi:hypothetical protein